MVQTVASAENSNVVRNRRDMGFRMNRLSDRFINPGYIVSDR
jgi:hypothetical protein